MGSLYRNSVVKGKISEISSGILARFMSVLLAASLTACNQVTAFCETRVKKDTTSPRTPVSASKPIEVAFLINPGATRSPVCNWGSGGPEEESRADFMARRDEKANAVTKYTDISCVEQKYTLDELKTYAANGDPVASYGVVYLSYKDQPLSVLCAHVQDWEATLMMAAEIKTRIGGRDVTRVPELYPVIGDMRAACFGEFDPMYIHLGVINGFDGRNSPLPIE